MEDVTHNSALSRACRLMLRPIARLLIRSSIPFKDFVELAKEVFVDVAGEDYGIRGRETNSSRVSILTGISRRDVGRIRKSARERERDGDLGYVLPATRVLAGWHQDADFCDSDGNPRSLPGDANGEAPSIIALLKRYGGDLPPKALLGELEQVGAVEQLPNGEWRVQTRHYMPKQLDLPAIARSGSVLEDLGNTINHNLFREGDEASRFEGRATRDAIPRADAGEFFRFVEARAVTLLEESDDWLARHEGDASADAKQRRTTRLGVGIYLIQD